MSYHWFNRQEFLQKAKNRYHSDGGKEEVAKYYSKSRKVLREKARNRYRSLSEKKRSKMRIAKRKISHENCFK